MSTKKGTLHKALDLDTLESAAEVVTLELNPLWGVHRTLDDGTKVWLAEAEWSRDGTPWLPLRQSRAARPVVLLRRWFLNSPEHPSILCEMRALSLIPATVTACQAFELDGDWVSKHRSVFFNTNSAAVQQDSLSFPHSSVTGCGDLAAKRGRLRGRPPGQGPPAGSPARERLNRFAFAL